MDIFRCSLLQSPLTNRPVVFKVLRFFPIRPNPHPNWVFSKSSRSNGRAAGPPSSLDPMCASEITSTFSFLIFTCASIYDDIDWNMLLSSTLNKIQYSDINISYVSQLHEVWCRFIWLSFFWFWVGPNIKNQRLFTSFRVLTLHCVIAGGCALWMMTKT